ncbi:NUDIX hydrolase [Qiania dongpingensis]|uniref:NUDIX domain-containing protein n=1 Tax=Qiania dongpingensis TaxID=2763669 RepID=A0A7G9G5M4_9FIRM|nr:NUDIX domain-containing protein [Qiania dongpingensis]QNM06106.1 NUDIX domain-containing protein [Qiania dongpingensis]
MEYFDVLTEDGKPTGEKKARQLVHRDGDWHGASRVWIVRRLPEGDGGERVQVLLQRRSEEKDSYPGLWDVAAAGHVSAGDGYLETAIRETKEEMGISLESGELQFLFCLKSESSWEYQGISHIDREFHYVFLAEKDAGISSFCLQKEEVAEVRWMDAKELYHRLKDGSIPSCIHWEEYEKLYAVLAEKK